MTGPVVLIGCPGSGKTHLARQLAGADVGRTGFPLLVIDSARVDQFQDLHHAQTVREAIERVWGQGLHTAFTPEAPEQFDRLAAAARAGKRCVILIDELKNVLPSVRSMSLPFQLAMRLWRHSEIEGIYATTQSYADAARPLRAVVSKWFVFRMTAPQDLEAIRQDLALEPAEIAALPSAKQCVDAGRPVSDAYREVKVGF